MTKIEVSRKQTVNEMMGQLSCCVKAMKGKHGTQRS